VSAPKAKYLFVGLGSIGQRHARNLRALLGDKAELLAYRVRGLKRTLTDTLEVRPGVDLEKELGIRTVDSLEAGLAEKPRAAFVCNPNSLHMETALAAAKAGCHLFIEKPVSHDLDGAEELQEIVEKKKLTAFVAYQMRFHPVVQKLQELLGSGAIGKPIAARVALGENMADWHKYEDYRDTYAAKKDGGGGVVLCQIHEIDLVYSLFGAPRRVLALGGKYSRLELEVEDVASALLDYGFPVHLHLDCVSRPPMRQAEILGDDGKLVADLREPSLKRYDGKGKLVEDLVCKDFQRNQLFKDELKHFLDCIGGKGRPIVTIEDGLESLRIALDIKRAIAGVAA
jgi:predicted dehydrogenase